MKTLKERFSFLSKYLFLIKIVLVVLLSCSSITMAYLYGSTSNQTKIKANLMQVDYEVKHQQNTNFLHGHLLFSENLSDKQKYDESMNVLKRSLYKNKYFNAYMVSAKNGEERLYQANTGIENLEWNNFSVTMVRNFWDYKMMESIALPLFRHEGVSAKNGIRKTNEDADAGSYISARTAYDFVLHNGMLEHNNGDIVAAFNELLDNTDYYYSINSGEKPISRDVKLTINNIYLTEEYAYLMDASTTKLEKRTYRDFYKTFSRWNDQSVITYSQLIFTQGFNFTFDIAGSYYNFDYFIKNIIGADYADNNLSLRFIGDNIDIEKYSDEVNKYSVGKESNNYTFLAISISLFALMIFAFVWLFDNIKKIKNKFVRVVLYLLPFAPFVAVQIFFHTSLLISSKISSMYCIFNSIGNTIIVLFSLICLTYSLFWSVINDD